MLNSVLAFLPTASAQTLWSSSGNFVLPGMFLGSTNFEAIDFRAGNVRVLRLEPDPRGALAGNLVGGFISNRVEQPGSGGNVIAGGGYFAGFNIVHTNTQGVFIGAGSANEIGPDVNDAVIAGGFGNVVRGFLGAIGGGAAGEIQPVGYAAVIAGGFQNTNAGQYATIGGGYQNSVSNTAATIGGGGANFAGPYATVGGGFFNIASGAFSTIAGGGNNAAAGQYSFAAGFVARALHDGSFVWADSSSGLHFPSTATNEFSVRATGGARFVTSGAGLTLDGVRLTASGSGLAVNGKPMLTAQPAAEDAAHRGIANVVNGSPFNSAATGVYGATIGGGGAGNYNGSFVPNTVTADFGTVGGGSKNASTGLKATVAGGGDNTSSGFGATVGGGNGNTNSASFGTIGGGLRNTNGGVNATVGGGNDNTSSGQSATVPGGSFNSAAGTSSFAAGQRASAAHNGSFVWSDASSSTTFASTAANQFLIRAAGGVGIGLNNPAYPLDVAGGVRITKFGAGTEILNLNTERNWAFRQLGAGVGAALELASIGGGGNKNFVINTTGAVGIGTTAPVFNLHVNGSAGKPGGGSWSVASDQRLKKNIRPLSGALEKLLALHGVTFEYIEPARIQELSGERMGLVAQEVEKVFPDWVETGTDGFKRVTVRGMEALMVEALRELQHRQDARLAEKDAEIEKMESRLAKLERLLEVNETRNRK